MMATKHFWLFLIIFITVTESSEKIKIHLEEKTSNLIHCLANIIENIKSKLLKISIFDSFDSSSLIINLLHLIKVPVIINTEEYILEDGLDTRTSNDIVIVLNKSIEVSLFVNGLLWHGRTKFFLLLQNKTSLKNIFQQFWNQKIVNVFTLTEESENVLVHTFLPYRANNCERPEPILVDRWSNGTFLGDGMMKIKDEIKITNMNHCPVNITVVDVKPNIFFHDDCFCNQSHYISGMEGNVMKEISKKLNMDAIYLIALDGVGWGWIKPQPQGVVGEVYTGRSDFGIGLLAPTIERFKYLDLSVQLNGIECITYGVPKGAGARQPRWIAMLLFEFSMLMWITIGIIFIIVLVFFCLTDEALKLSLFKSHFDLILYLLGSCLGIPVKVYHSFTLRIILISWITYTFILTVAYKSSMGSKLTVPTSDPDINTFKELLQSDLELTGYNNMLRLMQYNDSEEDIKLMADRFKVTNFDIEYAVDFIARYRSIAHVRHSMTFAYYSLINAKARGHIHLIRDCIYKYYPVLVMKKNSPFKKLTNQIISSLNEGGIVQHWKSNYIHPWPKKPKNFIKLSLSHTFGMFFIIVLGFILSFVTFIGELILYYFSLNFIH